MNLEASLDFSVPIINPSGIIRQGAAGLGKYIIQGFF